MDAEDLGEILLPRKHWPHELAADEHLKVFLYHDSESRPVATTQKPKAEVGEFAYLNVVSNSDYGTFLDWGLDKDLLAPFGEQHRPMEVGHAYLVYIYLNKADGRITASSKVEKFLIEDQLKKYDVWIIPAKQAAGEKVKRFLSTKPSLGKSVSGKQRRNRK
jgi:hypothetical protein